MSLRNPIVQFQALLPARPLQVGTVVAVEGETATVELAGGGRLQVRGKTIMGARVFVRDSVIESAAPDLTYVSAEL